MPLSAIKYVIIIANPYIARIIAKDMDDFIKVFSINFFKVV